MGNQSFTKNIWVFHHYATPPTMNGFTRPYNFAKNMNNQGFKTTIFAASYLHFADVNLIKDNALFYEEQHSDVSFVFVKTPSSNKNGITRVINMFSYYKNLLRVIKLYLKKHKKPDAIIASS